MDYRAVLVVFLCLHAAPAACRPVKTRDVNGAVRETIHSIQEKIRTALGHLSVPGMLPDTPCAGVNAMDVFGPEPLPLASIRCHASKMSEVVPDLAPGFDSVAQLAQDAQLRLSGELADADCSLPAFAQDVDGYVYVRCALRHLDQRLSDAKL